MTDAELVEVLGADVIEGTKALLGAEIVKGELRARIVETEAYRASDDPASHAYRGKTARNWVMFGPPGFAYIYFNYGVHWMLNVTCHDEGDAAAVLIRAAVPLAGVEEMRARRGLERGDRDLLSGPGKLAKAFDLSGADTGKNLFSPESDLRVLARADTPDVLATSRIGLAVGKGHDYPWRFLDANALKWLSRRPPRQ